MTVSTPNNTSVFSTNWWAMGLMVMLILFGAEALAQNTKGDTPNRENRFKSSAKKSKTGDRSVKRIKSRSKASGGERAGKPIRPVFSVKPPASKQKAWKGDISGRRIRTQSPSGSGRYVQPQQGPYVRKSIPDREGRQNVTISRKRVRTVSGKRANVYANNRYKNTPSSRPRDTQRAVSNQRQIARLKSLQSGGVAGSSPGRKTKVTPRSASRPYIARKSINVYANFRRPKQKGEVATTRDLAGRRLRGKNYETPRPGIINATIHPSQSRRRVGDRPYSGSMKGGYRSATKPGRAWTGDIAKRRIRHRDRSSKKSIEGTPYLAKRIPSATRSGESRTGKAVSPLSRSGGRWNNNGSPIAVRTPGGKATGVGYSGNLKRTSRIGDQGEEFSGSIKARRPLKGGGSVSGKLWNNQETAIAGRQPKQGARAAEYQGNLKTRRPDKGGGSVSGKLWNNNQTAIAGRQPKQGARAAEYQGNIKTGRPDKGGGSVSGTLWNNNESPIAVRRPSEKAAKAGAFSGNQKLNLMKPRFSDQGEEYTGSIKLNALKKNTAKNRSNTDEALSSSGNKKLNLMKPRFSDQGEEFTGFIKHPLFKKAYVQNKNSAEESLKKKRPDKTTQLVDGLQVKVKQYDYKRNPSSAEDALRVREPGKAFARSTDYQGNIKMQKYTLFERNHGLHPDAKFVKLNRNNVAEERDTLTNFKLWWARLFRKQETQPDHLKDKGKKPRYDKGEQGLWYD